ncbi:MAG: tol-pal system YbgF family protein [Gemmataceae bacterium]
MSTLSWVTFVPILILGTQVPQPPPTNPPPKLPAEAQSKVPKAPPLLPPNVSSSPLTPPKSTERKATQIPTPSPFAIENDSGIQQTEFATPKAPPDGDFHVAVSLLESGGSTQNLTRAAQYLSEYLKNHPMSRRSPEAAYRLAMTYQLLGKKEQANKILTTLTHEYYSTYWGQVVVRVHLDQAQLKKLWKEKYSKARKENDRFLADQTAFLLHLSGQRFPNMIDKSELAYRLAMCSRILGNKQMFDLNMKTAAAPKSTSDWSKLARCYRGTAETFRKQMDELMSLNSTNDETKRLFLELLDKHRSQLAPEEKTKSLYYQAYCLESEETKKRKLLWNQVVTQSPRSKWGRKASLALAELAYQSGHRDDAFRRYKQLLVDHPSFPERDKVVSWVQCWNQDKQYQLFLGQFVGDIFSRVQNGQGGFAFHLKASREGSDRQLVAQFANQGPRTLLDVRFGRATFFLTGTKDNSTLLLPDGKNRLVSQKGLNLPGIHFFGSLDPVNNKGTILFKSCQKDQANPIRCDIPKEDIIAMLPHWLGNRHITVRVHKTNDPKRQAYAFLFESVADTPDQDITTVEAFIEGGNLRTVRFHSKLFGKNTTIRMTNIRIAEPLPANAFTVPQKYAALPVRQTQEALDGKLWMFLMMFGSEILQEFAVDGGTQSGRNLLDAGQ